MPFGARIKLKDLIELCRTLRHNLGAGLTLHDVFRQQARRGPVSLRPRADRIRRGVEQGDSLQICLEREDKYFPYLFLALATVGEESGNLPDVFAELEKYYRLQQRLWRQFISQITMPTLQLLAAIFVIALMLLVLGMLGSGGKGLDPFGLGVGPEGAGRFLLLAFGGLTALAGLYFAATRGLRGAAAVDGLLLRLPAMGPCLEAIALTRFCLALRLTLDTALPIVSALRLSLRATGNAAYALRTDTVVQSLKSGDELGTALARHGLFPVDFLNIVAVAEEGGRVPEVMRHQAEYYEEEAARRLTTLTHLAGFSVWLIVAGLIVFSIFRIFTTAYLGALNQAF